jgi:hypothetical protein
VAPQREWLEKDYYEVLGVPKEPDYVHLVWAVRRVTPTQARWIAMFYGEDTLSVVRGSRPAGTPFG